MPQYVGDEHRRGLLHVVVASMEEWVEGELWTALQIEPLFAPRHLTKFLTLCEVPWIEAYADRGILIECLQEAVEACFTHHLPRFAYEFLW